MIAGVRQRLRMHDLPLGGDDAFWLLPWVFAFFAYVAGVAAIGLLLIHDTLRTSEASVASHLTAQVPAEASEARLQTILATLRQTAGVRAVHLLTSVETARLLEPWLGKPVPVEELPIPRVVDVEIDPSAAIDLAKLRQQVITVVPEARLDDQRTSLDGLRAVAWPLRAGFGTLIAAALLLTALLAIFVIRTALTARQTVIELLHLLGAADRDIARPLAVRSARLALIGGAIGGLALVITIVALGDLSTLVAVPVAGIGFADWPLWAIVVGIAAAAGLVAAASALATMRRRLARMT